MSPVTPSPGTVHTNPDTRVTLHTPRCDTERHGPVLGLSLYIRITRLSEESLPSRGGRAASIDYTSLMVRNIIKWKKKKKKIGATV